MPENGPDTLVRRMALTHAEFLRTLPRAAPGMDCRIQGAEIQLSAPPRRVLITLDAERTRTLGSLLLPETEVHLRWEGFSPAEREAFLARFDLAFRRGGG
jgi:hypothetical protein